MYTYLLLHVFTVAFPLSYSFESKIAFYKKWKYLFLSILPVATFFIVWDHFFTVWGVWNFNPKYVVGIFIAGLPVEEWLFFITVPFSCVFIYEAWNYFGKKDLLTKYSFPITYGLVILILVVAALNLGKIYTSVTFAFTAVALLISKQVFGKEMMGKFYMAYLFHLIPFFVVNGILTALPVVSYDDTRNLGIRLGTIPLEDTMYSMLLLLMNISLYEYFQGKAIKKTLSTPIYTSAK